MYVLPANIFCLMTLMKFVQPHCPYYTPFSPLIRLLAKSLRFLLIALPGRVMGGPRTILG